MITINLQSKRICRREGCGNPISPEKRPNAKWCSLHCAQKVADRKRYSKPHPCNMAGCEEIITTGSVRCIKHSRISNLMNLHHITLEQFNDILARQDGCCAICKTLTPSGRGTWKVDHDHKTGKVRGLLCQLCNLMVSEHFEKYYMAGANYIETSKLRLAAIGVTNG